MVTNYRDPDWKPTTKLSRREWLVLRMIAGGMSTKHVSVALSVTLHTAKGFAKRGRRKLEARGHRRVRTSVDLQRLVEQGIF